MSDTYARVMSATEGPAAAHHAITSAAAIRGGA